jgi:translation initiation factor 1 (eIF-1/SUI1)
VIPLVEGGTVVHRSIAALAAALAALALAGCGGGGEEAAERTATEAEREQAAVLVTRDCGREEVVARTEVPAGQTAMQALERVAEVEKASGGKFVTAIEGVSQDEKKKLAWLFYVDGEMAEKGATEIRLQPGDVEWWDLHNWEKQCPVPREAR